MTKLEIVKEELQPVKSEHDKNCCMGCRSTINELQLLIDMVKPLIASVTPSDIKKLSPLMALTGLMGRK